MRRAPPGPQLGTGRLRVDAARAISKLREYRLADRAAWVLEAIRAAVAAGATRIALTCDANDLWLCWDGPAWAAEDLPRLFDELVSPAASDDRYHVRLLAAAVNSALGGEPAFVDVFAIAGGGAAVRARYTPGAVAEPQHELDDAPLRQIAVEPAAPPAGAGPGMAIHLRRRFGLGVLSNLVGEVAEVQLARTACRDLAVPLFVRGGEVGRRVHRTDLVRIPLGEGLGGFVAVTDPSAAAPRASFEVAEHGVVLAACAIALGFPDGEVPIPLRVFIDGPRMPSNASRSEVRQDQHPISTALRRVTALLPKLAWALEAEITGGPRAARAREAAIGLVAAMGIAAASKSWLAPLLALPLARNAVGESRRLDEPWTHFVYTGAAPLPEELAPWLADLPWVPPGDPSARLFTAARAGQDTADHVRWARRQLRAKRRFYRHAARPAVVGLESARIRVRLGDAVGASCVDAKRFEDLVGQVAIREGGDGGELVVLLHGRELERVRYDSPIPFAAVIDSPSVMPGPGYRSAARDAEFLRIEAAMRAGVLRAVEALAAADPAGAQRLALDGLALARELAELVRPTGPLFEAPLWRLTGGGAASTNELRRCAVLGVVAPGARLRPIAGRTVVEVEARDRKSLAALVPHAPLVDYDAVASAAAPPIDLARELARELPVPSGFALALYGDGFAAAIAVAAEARVVLSHLGRRLGEHTYQPRFVACAIHVDSDAFIPDAAWRGAAYDGDLDARIADWELALIRAAAEALAGARSSDLVGDQPVELNGQLGRALCAALAKCHPDELLGPELAVRLRAARLWRILGEAQLVSARDLTERFTRIIPHVGDTGAPITGFAPLVADAVLATAAGALAGRTTADATAEVGRRRVITTRAAKLTAHRARPVIPLVFDGIHVEHAAPGVRALVGVAHSSGMEIEVRVEGRPLTVLRRADELPLRAIADVPADRVDDAFANLTSRAATQLVHDVREVAPALLRALAAAQPAALGEPGPVRMLLARALAELRFPAAARAELAAAAAFWTVQGACTSLTAAARGGSLATASWEGEWLGPAPGEPRSPRDEPVLCVARDDRELAAILERLHGDAIADVTDAVDKLQAHRRMKRGLQPAPAVRDCPRALVRRLVELGEADTPGEIGLVNALRSTVLIHVNGALRRSVLVGTVPAIELAIEGDTESVDALAARAKRLAARLVSRLVAEKVELPAWARAQLRRAVLEGKIREPSAPLFDTTTGALVDRAAIDRQLELFGDVWNVPPERPGDPVVPLDERRIVLLLDLREETLAALGGIRISDARRELALDARARENRARPAATALAFEPDVPVLASVTLDGDGVTAPRGVVGVLAVHDARYRGIYAHRALHPFDRVDDECRRPTIAIIDDARLTPDRTWSRPVEDDAAWLEVKVLIGIASDRAARAIPPPKPAALPQWASMMKPLPLPSPKPAPPPKLPKPERRPHPIDPLVDAIWTRFDQLGVSKPKVAIIDAATDPLAHHDGMLYLAGAHPTLVAISAALVARSAWSAAAVDALAAHLVCVLNTALTSVTDATEQHALRALLRSDRAR